MRTSPNATLTFAAPCLITQPSTFALSRRREMLGAFRDRESVYVRIAGRESVMDWYGQNMGASQEIRISILRI